MIGIYGFQDAPSISSGTAVAGQHLGRSFLKRSGRRKGQEAQVRASSEPSYARRNGLTERAPGGDGGEQA